MNKTRRLLTVCMIAAVYTVVSMVLAPISFGNIQCRISEALTLLPLIYAPAVPGVILGCFLTNLIGALSGADIIGFIDCVAGTLATAIAAVITYRCRDIKTFNIPLISLLAPIAVNGVIIGLELAYILLPENFLLGFVMFGLEVAAGEIIAVVLGYILVKFIEKTDILKN